MPPMLYIAFGELAGSRAQQMFPRHFRLRDAERHHVLKLIAKAVSTAGLIARRARPDAAGKRLVEEPAIKQKVHRTVGRTHLNRAQDVIPALRQGVQYGVEIGGPVARDQGDGFRLARCFPEKENDFSRLVGRELKLDLEGAARIETSAG